MERKMRMVAALLVLPFLPFSCQTQPMPSDPSLTCPEDDPLVTLVREAGSLRVIATLEMEVTPETDLDAEAAAEQRRSIAALQDQVVALIEGTEAAVHRRYELFPVLSLAVDEAALCRLLTSPLVRQVQQDVPEPPGANF
jgi:hypothetical protein